MPEDIANPGAIPDADKNHTAENLPGAEPGTDAKPASSSDENVPFDKDPRWKSARLAEKKLQDLLKANDLDDPDDLADLVSSGKLVKGKLSDLNVLDDLIEKAGKLEKYEAYWKSQEEANRKLSETPEETIQRLEAQLKKRDAEAAKKNAEKAHIENLQAAVTGYESEVKSLIGEVDLPKEQKAFMAEFFGVGNQCNEIDITDKKAVRKLIAEGIKKKEAYDQSVIKAYIESKQGIPKMQSAAASSVDEKKPKIMLKDARKIFKEAMQKASGG